MKQYEIKNALNAAKRCFLDNDDYLLSAEVNERSITHKFAEYLQDVFGCAWDVDCEYNRFGQDAKKIIEAIEQIVGTDTTTSEIKTKTVYPDIIVHKRGIDGPNLLVIEAKKDANDNERETDRKKLIKIKQKYEYNFAVFLNFTTGNSHDIEIMFVDN